MSDTPWSGDVVGLVEVFRAGERSPSEELEATLTAVEASDLNAVCHVDAEAARWLRPPPMSHSRTEVSPLP